MGSASASASARRRWGRPRRLRHCWTMPRDALIPFAERRASERAAERASERANIRGRALFTFSRPSPSSSLPDCLYPSTPLHSTPLLCRKQQFTSFIRRHERMKNGGSRHHPLPSLSRPPAAVYDALHMRGHLLRVFGAAADADGALIGSQV